MDKSTAAGTGTTSSATEPPYTGRVELHRQERPVQTGPSSRPEPPSRVAEDHAPLLGDWFIYLSVIVLIAGVVAITALELGTPLNDGLVRFPALIAAGLLIVLSADAALRTWRSAWAWLKVDRGRGLFRFVWAAVMAVVLVASIATVGLLIAA